MKILLFDLGGVCLSNYWSRDQRKLFSEKFEIDSKKVYEFHIKHVKEFNCGKLSEKEYFQKLFEYVRKEPEVEKGIKFLRDQCKASMEMLKFISILKNKYLLYSHTNENKQAGLFRIEKFDLQNYFQNIFVSGEIGFEKPDSKFYSFIIDKLKCNPQDIIFVDDHERNLIPAREIGMKTILFENLDQFKKEMNKL